MGLNLLNHSATGYQALKERKEEMDLASINVAPIGCSVSPSGATIFMFQGVRDLEEYVEEFVGVSHLAQCNHIVLLEGFWIGLCDEIWLVMQRGNSCWTLAEYINFTFWVSGSSFTVVEIEEDPATSVQSHSPSVNTPEPDSANTPTMKMEQEPSTD